MEDDHFTNTESLMRYLDSELQIEFTYNVLYYIVDFIVKSLMQNWNVATARLNFYSMKVMHEMFK